METCLVIEPGKMVLVIPLDIRQVAHGLFGLSHIRERVFHPTILPFPDVNHMGHLLLYHQEFYLPILQVGMQLLHCCHAALRKKYDPSFFFRTAGKLVKRLNPDDIESSSKVGIRAQLVDWNTKEMVMDFLVHQDGEAVHILNPVSPAFTCSMELAKQVVKKYF